MTSHCPKSQRTATCSFRWTVRLYEDHYWHQIVQFTCIKIFDLHTSNEWIAILCHSPLPLGCVLHCNFSIHHSDNLVLQRSHLRRCRKWRQSLFQPKGKNISDSYITAVQYDFMLKGLLILSDMVVVTYCRHLWLPKMLPTYLFNPPFLLHPWFIGCRNA